MERKWWTLAAVCTAVFMLLMDITIVNVALPDISESLGAEFTELQWVVDAYTLSLAALLLTAGSLADILGRRVVFVAGFAIFTGASLVCGLAGSPTFLIVARAVQGIGGAAMFATSVALIAEEFRGRDRGTAFGAFGATAGAAIAIGPLVGGGLTSGIGWEWIFFVNVPIGIAAIAITWLRVAESRDPNARGVDWPGAATFTGALALLILGLLRGNEEGWGSPLIVGSFAGFAVLLLAFVVVERRSSKPMFDLGLFRKPAFVGVSIAAFGIGAGMLAMFLFVALYMQRGLGYSAIETGVRFLPITLAAFFAAGPAGRLASHVPVRYLLALGLGLTGVGLLWMRELEPGSEWTVLIGGFILAGAGSGMTNPPLAASSVAVVPPERAGMGSGINNTFRQAGIATGIAALGALFQARVEDRVLEGVAGAGLGGRASALAEEFAKGGATGLGSLPAGQQEAVARTLDSAFVSGLDLIFLVGAVITLAAAVASLVLVKQEDLEFTPGHAPAAA